MKIKLPTERLYVAQYNSGLPDRSPGRYTFYGVVVALYFHETIPEDTLSLLEDEHTNFR